MLHPEIQEEIEAVEAALIGHASASVPGKLPAAFKNQVWDSLNTNTKEEKAPALTVKSAPRKDMFMNMISFRAMAAAAIILLVISIGINTSLYMKLDKAEATLLSMQGQQELMAQDMNIQQARLDLFAQNMQIMRSSEIRKVVMNGTPNLPKAVATVYWNPKSEEVYLMLDNLADAPKGKQYQLWAIVDGKPVDMGVFDSHEKDMLIKVKNTGKAQAFAVTVENEGGSPAPTLSAMVLLGSV